jgi:hypothetical protein
MKPNLCNPDGYKVIANIFIDHTGASLTSKQDYAMHETVGIGYKLEE